MENNKYKSQIKYRKNNLKQFNIDFNIDVLEKFKEVCRKKGEKPTTVIKKFVDNYIKDNL